MPDEMIIRHCAPTLAGMKTGNMFTYHFKDSSELRKQIECFVQRKRDSCSAAEVSEELRVNLFVQTVKAFKRSRK